MLRVNVKNNSVFFKALMSHLEFENGCDAL